MMRERDHVPLKEFMDKTGIKITAGHYARCKREVRAMMAKQCTDRPPVVEHLCKEHLEERVERAKQEKDELADLRLYGAELLTTSDAEMRKGPHAVFRNLADALKCWGRIFGCHVNITCDRNDGTEVYP
jgi:hypothetical protein